MYTFPFLDRDPRLSDCPPIAAEDAEFNPDDLSDLDIDDGLEQNCYPSADAVPELRTIDVAALLYDLDNEPDEADDASRWLTAHREDDVERRPAMDPTTLLERAVARLDDEETEMLYGYVAEFDDDTEDEPVSDRRDEPEHVLHLRFASFT